MAKSKKIVTAQEFFDLAVTGVIIQGYVHRATFIPRVEGHKPRRCAVGHATGLGLTRTETERLAVVERGVYLRHTDLAWYLIAINDNRCTVKGLTELGGFRQACSSLALGLGLDDSCCWMDLCPAGEQ